MFDKSTFFDQISVSLFDVCSDGVKVQGLLASLFADRHIEGLDAEVA
jgi:hypothetical protein